MADLDVDVISLEAARSNLATVAELASSAYQGDIGPGIYDVHSPRVPSVDELSARLAKVVEVLGPARVWVNPDCGLKTRDYQEVKPALRNLVEAARRVRTEAGTGGRGPEP